MKTSSLHLAALAVIVSTSASTDTAFGGFSPRSVGGDATTASIQGTVDLFRADLGNPNNANTPGPLASGRREINWDGGGAATTPAGTPFLGFQNNRGAAFTTPGTGFVQAPPSGMATFFSQPSYATEFSVFSAQRLFTPIGSNITDVTFFIPGSSGAIPATVSGFGAVFTDVDDASSTTRLQFFDFFGSEIFNQTVPEGTTPSGSLSFLGATANAGEKIFRVRIETGNVAPGVADGVNDVVMMDDFLFSEPVAIPEPTTALFGLGLVSACLAGRGRRRP